MKYNFFFSISWILVLIDQVPELHELRLTANVSLESFESLVFALENVFTVGRELVFRRVHKTSKSDCQLRHVCPSVHMEQLCSHWTVFHEMWYSNILRKSVEKIPVSLQSDKNNRYFTWRRYASLIISRSVRLIMRNFSNKSCKENQNTHFVFSNCSSKIVPVMR